MKYPGHERQAGRPLRRLPDVRAPAELGAAFGEKSGWERANWFEPNAARGDESLRPRGWAGRLWSPAIGAEHVACRETAALFDETSFAKIEVSGDGAAAFLEHLCANRVARDVGAITYTSMLNAPRRDRVRLHGHAPRRRAVPDRHRHGVRPARPRVDPRARARRRRRRGRHLGVRLPRPLGPEGPRDPPAADDDAARLPVHARPRARGRAGPVPRAARHLRRRARLGALLPDRVRPRALGRDLGAGREHRPRRRRLQGDRLAAAREGLPRLGLRHHARRHAVRGGLAVRGQARQGRLHRPRRAARGAGAGTAPLLPDARRPARGRARLRAGARRRRSRSAASRAAATATRSSARSPTPTCRPTAPSPGGRSRSRSSASGSPARSRPSRSSTRRTAMSTISRRRTIEPLGGGITNHNFKVTAGGESFVLRIGGNDTEPARDRPHGRARRVASTRRRSGSGPRSSPSSSRRATSSPASSKARPGGSTSPRRRRCSRRLHDGPPIPGRFDCFRVVEAYGELRPPGVQCRLGSHEARRPDRGPPRRPPARPVPQRPAAGELHPTATRLWIVDWEYAGMGDPAFDLANFAVNNGLPIGDGRSAPSTS